MEEKIKFELTGNFQYDIGLLGIKRVLDFFEVQYKSDEFSLTINKEVWSKMGHYAYLYGYSFKGLEAFAKKIKAKKYSGKNKDFERLIKDSSNKTFEEFLSLLIDFFKDESNEVINNLKVAGAAYPALNVMNVSHLNMFNPGDMKKIKNGGLDFCIYYNRFINKFKTDAKACNHISKKSCDFCQKYEGEKLNRTNFLFAPASMNLYWFEEPSIFICPYCAGLNLFANYGTFTTETNEKYFIHSSNLTALERDNTIAARSFEEYILEYIKHIVRVQVETMDRLFIEMRFSGQEPDIDFLPLTSHLLQFFYENNKLFEKLHENDFTGKAKTPIIRAFRDTIVSLINGEDLTDKVDLIANCIIKQASGNKNIQGFDSNATDAAIVMLNISLKLKGVLDMNPLEDFKQFGDKVRAKIYAGKSRNAAKNKAVSFSASLRDAVNESKEKLMETLLQLSIYSEVPMPCSMVSKLSSADFNYKEAGLAVALTLMCTE
jgi:CRISPR-associated protein Cst1